MDCGCRGIDKNAVKKHGRASARPHKLDFKRFVSQAAVANLNQPMISVSSQMQAMPAM